jgi:hypothetical protein
MSDTPSIAALDDLESDLLDDSEVDQQHHLVPSERWFVLANFLTKNLQHEPRHEKYQISKNRGRTG